MKTSKLIGPALDWSVAKCEGIEDFTDEMVPYLKHGTIYEIYSPSTDWAQGGPIIEREKITCFAIGYIFEERPWSSSIEDNEPFEGPTPLVAAMRCYVASKIGDDVAIPKELQN